MPRTDRPIDEWNVVYGVIVVLVAGLLFYSMRPVTFSPAVLFVLLLLLLMPYAGTPKHTIVVMGAALTLFLWLIDTLGSLLAPFIIAIGIAYILDPLVDRLEARGLPRLAGVALLALPALAVLVLIIVIGIPALIEQVASLVQGIPAAAERVVEWLELMRQRLSRLNLPFVDPERVANLLSADRIGAYVEQRQAEILSRGLSAVLGVGRGFGFAFTVIGYLVLTPVLLVYLLRDFNRITDRASALIPETKRAGWLAFLREYDALLARFLRGQVVAAAIVGVLTWLGLMIVGFPYAGLVGVIAGVFNLVPYLGLVASVIPVLLIALLTGSFVASIFKAGIVFAIVQFIDGSITGPRIVGGSVGLHPVWVILALAVGSSFFGFVGLLLAMPAAVLIKLLLRESLTRYRSSRIFRGSMATGDGT